VRTALGGSRLHIIRQHLVESLLLSAAGGTLGFLLAYGIVEWFVGFRREMQRVEAIQPDGTVVGFTIGIVALCAVFAGLISSFSAKDNRVLTVLQDASRAHSAGRARTRLRATLLTLEVGLTVVLLIGAGLLLKSYSRLRFQGVGCATQNVLTMSLNLPEARYGQTAQRMNFFSTLLERVRNTPGVRAAGLVFPVVPGDGYGGDAGFSVAEHAPLPAGKGQYAMLRWNDPGYFAAIGIPMARGRTVGENQQPGHNREAVISRAFAGQYFPGEDPIGKHLKIFGQQSFEIVGIVGDTLYQAGEAVVPTMYVSLDAVDDINGAALVVRSDRDVTQLAIPIRRVVGQMDRDLPVSDILTMDQVIGRNTVDASFNAALLLGFAAISLVLAAIGLFGVLSYIVAQRTSEIGIRMALGAQRQQVMTKVLVDGLRPALQGLALGLAASMAASKLLRSMLYETRPLDPAVFGVVAAVLLLVACLACLVPSWRASRLDPVQALRTE
jgi:putative ABC transport system permease protein